MKNTNSSTSLVTTAQSKQNQPKVALVLSAGGVRGMAHIGVLEVLEKAGIVPDVIVGCSIGAIVGALYADTKDIGYTKKIALEMAPYSRVYRLFGMPSLYRGLLKGQGVFSMKKIHNYLSKIIQATTFETLQIPLIVTATNLNKAVLTAFSTGPLVEKICASSAIPGLFQPVQIESQYYIDGYILAPLPIVIAKNLKAQLTIGVNLCSTVLPITDTSEVPSVIMRSFNIANTDRTAQMLKQADIIIDPNFENVEYLFTSHQGAINFYEAGKKAANKMLPKLKAHIDTLANK